MEATPSAPASKYPAWKHQSPPVKILSSQLKQCEARPKDNEQTSFWLARDSRGGKAALEVTIVWMQGTIREITTEQNTSVKIQDDTGIFTVIGVDSVPKGKPCLSKGKYVMVMGVVQTCTPEPVLRAIKMTDISENPIYKSTWMLEVEDLQQTIP